LIKIWRYKEATRMEELAESFQPGQGQEQITRRGDRRLTPEEALFQAGRQIRQGTCSHCKKEYHYFKEYLAFWTKVQESRAAKAKADAASN
jgi:hypothetical protein